jgi:hypothetical protein
MNVEPADAFWWLATAGIGLLALGFIAGEVAAKLHYDHKHPKGGGLT